MMPIEGQEPPAGYALGDFGLWWKQGWTNYEFNTQGWRYAVVNGQVYRQYRSGSSLARRALRPATAAAAAPTGGIEEPTMQEPVSPPWLLQWPVNYPGSEDAQAETQRQLAEAQRRQDELEAGSRPWTWVTPPPTATPQEGILPLGPAVYDPTLTMGLATGEPQMPPTLNRAAYDPTLTMGLASEMRPQMAPELDNAGYAVGMTNRGLPVRGGNTYNLNVYAVPEADAWAQGEQLLRTAELMARLA